MNNQQYTCDQCGKQFDTERGLAYHKRRWCKVNAPAEPADVTQGVDPCVKAKDQRGIYTRYNYPCNRCPKCTGKGRSMAKRADHELDYKEITFKCQDCSHIWVEVKRLIGST